MSKIYLDKYYTDKDLAKYCTEKMASFTGVDDVVYFTEDMSQPIYEINGMYVVEGGNI